MIKAVASIIKGFWSLLVGMKVTIVNFFRPVITLQYPLERWKLPSRYRGLLRVKGFFSKEDISKKSRSFCEGQIPPCTMECPASTDIRGYLSSIAEGDYKRGVRILKETYPFSGSLGRVCPAFCEKVCNEGMAHDQPLTIRILKRFLDDYNLNLPENEKLKIEKISNAGAGRKSAVIGAGPAGLTCAADLAKFGVKVTVYEALPVAGGYLAVGIPEYRLPKNILKKEIEEVLSLGVELKLNTRIGKDISFEELMSMGYDAIFVATGATKPVKLGLPGEELEGVKAGEDFLEEVNLKGKAEIGKRVAVIGGGNTAIDCARTAVRLGADEVVILYRRTINEMPADRHEIESALVEGVKIKELCAPVKIASSNGRLQLLECCVMKLGKPDASGRCRPIPVEGCNFTLPFDTVFTAISRGTDIGWLGSEIKLTKWGTINVNFLTQATTSPNIFAGGDVTLGAATVIEAIACGKKAAKGILERMGIKN